MGNQFLKLILELFTALALVHRKTMLKQWDGTDWLLSKVLQKPNTLLGSCITMATELVRTASNLLDGGN